MYIKSQVNSHRPPFLMFPTVLERKCGACYTIYAAFALWHLSVVWEVAIALMSVRRFPSFFLEPVIQSINAFSQNL
jgi:hypothetical protein